MLRFEPDEHRYYWNGDLVPNVTRVLGGLVSYDHIPPTILQNAQREGTAIHKMVEQDCKGELDIQRLYMDPGEAWKVPRFEAWTTFKMETGFECIASEVLLYHQTYRYAGTADLFGHLTKWDKVKINGPVNIDIKRSFFAGSAIGLQTAAYTQAWNAARPRNERVPDANRFALRLDSDGKYRLLRFDDRNDFNVWTAQLVTYRWKEKHYGK